MTEGPRGDRSGSRPGAVAPTVLVAVVAAVLVWLYAWWAVGRQPFSAAATAAVVLPAVAVAAVTGLAGLAKARAGGCAPGRPAPTPAGVGRWAVVAAVATAWQLGAYLQHPRHDHPTLSSLTNAALDSHAARAAAFLAWLAVTVMLVRR
jgi:hypothetical protein